MGANAIVAVQWEIRRAVEKPLFEAAAAQVPPLPIHWHGHALETIEPRGSPPLPYYVATQMNWGDVQILTMGENPQFKANGGMTMVIRTPGGNGYDQSDQIAKIIANAYPYNLDSVFLGVTVHIDKMEPGAYGIDGPWVTGEVILNWTCYRRE